MSGLSKLYEHARRAIPGTLADWEDRVSTWCDEYADNSSGAELSETNLDFSIFIFDHVLERVVLAYAVSVEHPMKRHTSRMPGFPDPNVSAQTVRGYNVSRG